MAHGKVNGQALAESGKGRYLTAHPHATRPADPQGRLMPVSALACSQYFGYLIGNRIHVQGTCTPSVHAHAGRTPNAQTDRENATT